MTTETTADLAAGLRAWARGIYPLEAAAELLIRANHGQLVRGPWVTPLKAGFCRIDPDGLNHAGYLSGGERRVLDIVASLVGDERPVALYDALPGLDRDTVALVLAAVAHANGSHEHSRIVPDPDGRWARDDGARLDVRRLGSLYPWPGHQHDEPHAAAATDGGPS